MPSVSAAAGGQASGSGEESPLARRSTDATAPRGDLRGGFRYVLSGPQALVPPQAPTERPITHQGRRLPCTGWVGQPETESSCRVVGRKPRRRWVSHSSSHHAFVTV